MDDRFAEVISVVTRMKAELRLPKDQSWGNFESSTQNTFLWMPYPRPDSRPVRWNYEEPKRNRVQWSKAIFIDRRKEMTDDVCRVWPFFSEYNYSIESIVDDDNGESFVIDPFADGLLDEIRDHRIGPVYVLPNARIIAFTSEANAVIGRICIDESERIIRNFMGRA